ncbi:hypothetical protein [Primorskyibacter flagellatus]|uniref:Uncharacterized protein n=1 Tax=Primorskyibacter flagellatus TaxID=1387277 RepID=A0A1W2DVC6_9RHOB|nr:hypothetical protein [Primorskyibacter flagellatus]SMD00976.1 hypothetical protein SAMN06295998_11813 [Primorskyibacter flagellatus]
MNKTTNFGATPPANALRVEAWRDLPRDATPAHYRITDEVGDTRLITLSKGNRIILDALIAQPVFCASPVRISDRVCILRHEYRVPIIKEMYENDAATDRARFGVYFLNGRVECVEQMEGRT